MKKIKLFSLLTIAMVMLSGCTKEYYGAQVFTHEYKVVPGEWKRFTGANMPGSENYLYATFENSDITRDVVANGSVTADVWAVYDRANDLGSWHPLPYVYPFEVNVTYDDGTTGIGTVAEQIRLEWEEGKVTFIVQELDGWDPDDMINPVIIRATVTSNGIVY